MPTPAMKFVVTADDIEAAEAGGGEPAPAGFYAAEVQSVEYEDPKDKNDRWVVIYRIVDEDENYGWLYDYLVLTEAAKWKVTQYLVAVGAIGKPGNVDLKKVMPASKGKRVRVKVVNETYSPPDGEARITAKPRGVWADDGKGAKAKLAGTNGRVEELQNMEEAELADLEDEITALAEPLDIDPNEYTTWAEVVELIAAGGESDPDTSEAADEPDAGGEGVQDERWLEILGLDEEELAEIADELDTYGATYDLNADQFAEATWAEYVEAINDAMNGDGDTADTDGPAEDYNEWSIPNLKKECAARDLEATGTKAVLVKRLEENDSADPF